MTKKDKPSPKKTTSKRKRTGLGMNMDSLIPTEVISADFDPSAAGPSSSRTKNVPIGDVKPNPEQPRRDFDDRALAELVASIEIHGVLQPVLVVEMGEGYQLIAGERRWRAAQRAGLDRIPVIVRSMNEQAQLEIALIENVQRQDLSPLEAAQAYARLNKEFNATFDSIAERIGKSSSTVSNIVRLLNLPPNAQVALAERKISEGHARAILALDGDSESQEKLLRHILKDSWSVRKAEQFVKGVKEGGEAKDTAVKQTASETPETKQLAKRLKTTVRVYNMAKGGRLIIDYKDEADLKRISGKLTSS